MSCVRRSLGTPAFGQEEQGIRKINGSNNTIKNQIGRQHRHLHHHTQHGHHDHHHNRHHNRPRPVAYLLIPISLQTAYACCAMRNCGLPLLPSIEDQPIYQGRGLLTQVCPSVLLTSPCQPNPLNFSSSPSIHRALMNTSEDLHSALVQQYTRQRRSRRKKSKPILQRNASWLCQAPLLLSTINKNHPP